MYVIWWHFVEALNRRRHGKRLSTRLTSIILAPSVVRAGSHFRSAAAAAARFSSADERRLARRRSGRVRGGRVRGADYQGDVIAC